MGEEHLLILVAGYQDLESARLTLMPAVGQGAAG